MTKHGITIIILLLCAKILQGQICTNPGQTPSSAILVCSIEPISQATVPVCGQTNIPSCQDAFVYQNRNPYWYKMACYSPGTLGFTITPLNTNDNYDWQFFDVTSRNPDDVFTDRSLFAGSNWSTLPGETGASIDGLVRQVCYAPLETFSMMPDLVAGHEYLLMVSNHDGSPDGFQLTIGGGSASITDPLEPKLVSARQSCDGTKVVAKFSRGMRCSTLAANGSDFTISGGYTVTSAVSTGCGSNPTTDSVVLTLNAPLPNGNYVLAIQNGSDGNTLIDICNRSVMTGEQALFTVAPLQPTPMDSIKPVSCSPASLKLFFSRPIRCSSIAANGSDFIVTGPQAVVITNVTSTCNAVPTPATITSEITLQLASPIVNGGIYRVTLVTGSDGNTIIDECGRQTPSSFLAFTVKDTVSADFTFSIKASCQQDTLGFLHNGNHAVTSWNWRFDNATNSILQNPVMLFPATGQHTVRLIVSNGTCADTASVDIKLDNEVNAGFEIPAVICAGDTLHFLNKSTGSIDGWLWHFGDGNTSVQQTPSGFRYAITGREAFYSVRLIAINVPLNCRDTVTHSIKVLGNCYIAVPSAFTPNGDGLNDWLYPLNALKADDLQFRVYNRLGQLVFETRDWTRKWNGKINGLLQDTGIYAWLLSYTKHDTGEKVFIKGTTLLLR